MGLFVKKDKSVFVIARNIEQVFSAVIIAGDSVGKVKRQSQRDRYVVIRTGMKLLPPRNSATLKVSMKQIGDSQTEITFVSESFDGIIGFKSATQAIDQIIRAVDKALL